MHARAPLLILLGLLPGMLLAGLAAGEDVCEAYIPAHPIDAGALLRESTGPTGLLWRIDGQTAKASHIFGTIHLDNPRVTAIDPRVRLILVRSRKLMIEVLLDEKANQAYQRAIYQPAGNEDHASLRTLLGTVLYPRYLDLATREYGLPPAAAARLKPWAAFNLLARPRPRSGVVLDEVLSGLAARAGRPVEGIETMDDLLATLEAIPLDDQLEILRDTLCNHRLLMQQVGTLLRIYLARDLDALQGFNEQPHHDEAVFARFQQRILYRRNELMLQRVLPEIEQGEVFIAVGALHLSGPRGLLQRLREAGYRVTAEY